MEVLILIVILYLLFKPCDNSYKNRGGSRTVPPADYKIDVKVPKQPRSDRHG